MIDEGTTSIVCSYLTIWPRGTRTRVVRVITSAVVGMFFPYRHVGIICSRRRHACRHNSSFKIKRNTRQKTVKTFYFLGLYTHTL